MNYDDHDQHGKTDVQTLILDAETIYTVSIAPTPPRATQSELEAYMYRGAVIYNSHQIRKKNAASREMSQDRL